MKRSQFTFYRSFYDAIRCIRSKARLGEMILLICAYALDNEKPDPDKMTNEQKMIFSMLQPVLDSARKKAQSGAIGGSKSQAKSKQTESKGENKKEKESKNEIEIETKTETEIEASARRADALERRRGEFEIFWDHYPRKADKNSAYFAFLAADVSLDVLLEGIRRQSKSSQWTDGGGRYVPHPARWLTEQRWNDELPPALPGPSGVQASGELGAAEREAIAMMMGT